MKYQCEISNFSIDIEANSPAEAAERCVARRAETFSWFANESPQAVSVVVDGREYFPREYVTDENLVWG